MKCIYVLRTGVVINSVRHRLGMILVEGTGLYAEAVKAVGSQLFEDLAPNAFGLHCEVEDLAAKIKSLPLELRPKNGMSEDIDEAVARILKDLNTPKPEPGPMLKEKMTVYVARSAEPGASKPLDNRMKVTVSASAQSREDMRLAQEALPEAVETLEPLMSRADVPDEEDKDPLAEKPATKTRGRKTEK